MQIDEQTKQAIKQRMQELNSDPSFRAQLEKEISHLKGRNLKRYINREAVKKSEYEVRGTNQGQ